MKTQTLKTKLAEFNTSLAQLRNDEQENKQIQQNHFGDFLMIEEPKEWSKEHNYKVWLSHPENVKLGQPKWQIEYAGKNNGYRWETIAEGNK
jgi:hypothetical protein